MVSVIGSPILGSAQYPVCPQPQPDAPVYFACLPAGRYVAVRLLADLAIDHLLRGDNGPVLRDPGAVLDSVAGPDFSEENDALAGYLRGLEPVRLMRIDTSTGTLRMDVNEEHRSFATAVTVGTASYKVGVELPERIEGGYWRTPGVLQIAFWKGQRATFRAATKEAPILEAEIECLVVSADSLRLVTTDPSGPDILLGFGECQ